MLVDVHLDELDLALGGLHHLFQDRRELLAGAAPRRPEIDQHRLALGFLDHVLHEALRGRVLDHRRLPSLLPRRSAAYFLEPHLAAHGPNTGGSISAIRWVIRRSKRNHQGMFEARPETGSIRGGWPVDSRNFTRSSRPIDVVMVLTSG